MRSEVRFFWTSYTWKWKYPRFSFQNNLWKKLWSFKKKTEKFSIFACQKKAIFPKKVILELTFLILQVISESWSKFFLKKQHLKVKTSYFQLSDQALKKVMIILKNEKISHISLSGCQKKANFSKKGHFGTYFSHT